MSFPIIYSSQQTAEGRQQITSSWRGKPMPFFEEMADDGSGQWESIQPSQVSDPRPSQAQLGPVKSLTTLTQMTALMAMLRDAKYAAATRGELLMLGEQTKMLAAYDVGRMFNLAFT
jgi:hypothetical protein